MNLPVGHVSFLVHRSMQRDKGSCTAFRKVKGMPLNVRNFGITVIRSMILNI